jgi:hypothetical protein
MLCAGGKMRVLGDQGRFPAHGLLLSQRCKSKVAKAITARLQKLTAIDDKGIHGSQGFQHSNLTLLEKLLMRFVLISASLSAAGIHLRPCF